MACEIWPGSHLEATWRPLGSDAERPAEEAAGVDSDGGIAEASEALVEAGGGSLKVWEGVTPTRAPAGEAYYMAPTLTKPPVRFCRRR